MNDRIRIIITAAQPMILEGVKASLKQSKKFEIIGAAGNVQEFLALFQVNIDMVLLDIDIEHMKGEDLLEIILNKCPDQKVIIFSSFSEPHIQSDYMQKGT